jgi:hypothetical protein
LINAFGNAALAAIEGGQNGRGLALSNEAIGIAPKELWPHNIRADALTLLGRTDEARQIYLAHRGEHFQNGESWEDRSNLISPRLASSASSIRYWPRPKRISSFLRRPPPASDMR